MDALAHIRQSIIDIVTTPYGTRVMRPEYGSRVPRLVDNPVTQTWRLEIYVAIAEALHRWEPRIRLDHVGIDAVGPGYVELSITFRLQDGSGDTVSFAVRA
jgi:phage baseplate assembly protein W